MDAYYSLLGRAGGVASTPYQAYSGELTAPINAQQTAGINNINAGAGFAQPYIQQAAGYATNAAQPLSPAQIQQYQSPYTQSVVDATSNWFNNQNKQQQENVVGNAAAQGALGGDRVGVAKANLAAQQTASQAPVIAGLYNQGYQQAVGVAQQQQQNQANAAYSLGNLGVAGQNAALTGANAQVGAGSLEQQNEQQRLAALYQQYQIAQAFPYQQTQWLAGVDTGVGSQLGGTSQTTAPAPNPWAQVAGVGLTAASVFAKRGGRIQGFAPGGDVGGTPYAGVSGWIPDRQITMGHGAPPPPGVAKQPDGMADLGKGMNAFAKAAKNSDWGADAPMDISASGNGFTPSGVGATFSPGQFDMAGAGLSGIYRDGGRVRGFAPGGTVADGLAFADRWSPAVGAVADGTFDPQGLNGRADNFDIKPTVSDAGVVPVPRERPEAAPQRMIAGFAPAYNDARDDAIADRADGDTLPASTALGFAPDQQSPDQLPGSEGALPFASIPDLPRPDPSTFETPTEPKRSGFNLGLLPDNLRMPLMMAGLGMLASRSPNLGNAIGEGGIAGVQAYTQQKQAELQHAEKKQTIANQSRHLDLEAKRLDNAAEMSRKTLELHTKTAADTAEYRKGLLARENLKPVGTNEDGFPVYLDNRTGKEVVGTQKLQGKTPTGYVRNQDGTMAAIKGGPADPEMLEQIARSKRQGSALSDEAISFSADRVLAGDVRALTRLSPDNVAKVQTLVAKKAAEQGVNPNDIIEKVAEGSGLTAQQRTFGTQVARMAVNSTEAQGAIDLGRKASADVPRGNWVPVTKAIQAFQSGTSDPKLAAFGAANMAIINTYSRAISPTGTPTVHDKEHAEKLLSTATGPDAYNAVLDQMNKEIEIAHAAPSKAKDEMERIRKGQPAHGASAAGSPAATPDVVRQNGHTYQRQPDGSYKAVD